MRQAKCPLHYSIENFQACQFVLGLSLANAWQMIRHRKRHFVGASQAQ
jgi:hypothetical protein